MKHNGFRQSKMRLNQRGVALIQVLLTVSMILILIVQLSKGSKEQVNTAIKFKEKNVALLSIDSSLEKIKFDLLTKKRISNHLTNWNFYGKPFSYLDIELALQDETGLVSLPYFSDYLTELSGASNRPDVIRHLKLWQGTEGSGRIPAGFRGANMQYAAEVYQVPGWRDLDVPLSMVSYLPMYAFNPKNSPEDLLKLLAKNGAVEALLQKRAQIDVTAREINALINKAVSEDVSLSTSETIRANASVHLADWTITRSYRYRLTLDSRKPIQQIGY